MTTTLKTCFKCLVCKPLDAFYKHAQMGDGHLNKCIDCTKQDVAAHRIANIQKVRAYDRRRASMPHRLAGNVARTKVWRSNYPKRRDAHMQVQYALRSGRLQRLPCFVCGDKAEGHHPNYDAPLDVVWLCSPHHKQAHTLAKDLA